MPTSVLAFPNSSSLSAKLFPGHHRLDSELTSALASLPFHSVFFFLESNTRLLSFPFDSNNNTNSPSTRLCSSSSLWLLSTGLVLPGYRPFFPSPPFTHHGQRALSYTPWPTPPHTNTPQFQAPCFPNHTSDFELSNTTSIFEFFASELSITLHPNSASLSSTYTSTLSTLGLALPSSRTQPRVPRHHLPPSRPLSPHGHSPFSAFLSLFLSVSLPQLTQTYLYNLGHIRLSPRTRSQTLRLDSSSLRPFSSSLLSLSLSSFSLFLPVS